MHLTNVVSRSSVAPGAYTELGSRSIACGSDPRSGQPYRFNPQTGQPCAAVPQTRTAVRQVSPAPYSASSASQQPSPEEQRLAAQYQREHEAMMAPTGIRSENGAGTFPPPVTGTSRPDDLSQ